MPDLIPHHVSRTWEADADGDGGLPLLGLLAGDVAGSFNREAQGVKDASGLAGPGDFDVAAKLRGQGTDQAATHAAPPLEARGNLCTSRSCFG
jgi:hypothetical protein